MHKVKLLESQTIDADSLVTSVENLRYIDNYAVQINVSAVSNPVDFAVELQGSNDNENWVSITGTSNGISATGPIMINRVDDGFKYLRASFSRTSGTVTAEVILTGRERRI